MPSDKSETLTLSLPQQGTIQAEVYDKNNDNSSTSEINASQTVSGLELEYKGPEKADPNEVSLRPK
ncbi:MULTISPECIES: hypothetical protein [unclassified Haloferax]|uniref:hypothetical protein n=1 Tax=unclassified Haloferax TaxID=2625095 RepID=UPI00287515AA|nr:MULTISPECIES: hypothetical protein [unclassified Haloferax]MDS0242249.1 hypothetical protein [Haloferax sp. S2CR25]MDS0445370.1 hypothetical protein [Haloferax sp. S2CR25-2]